MNRQISPGELHVGQYVTILEWLPWTTESLELFGDTKTITHTDHSWCGDVLKIEVVQLPYVIVSHPNDFYLTSSTKLDTRRLKLMELTPEYVEAAKRH